MSSQDEVFGLPFLFTGGLPNALEKFSEGNLRCFLIYLIEVVGKANRQNVWQKPVWWKSKLIPYSPISVDTSRVPHEQVVKELRCLIESCYRYYNAEKILEVSRQLAEIPRILLGIRDNKDNTMTVYDTNSHAVYVTVRPENLYYDADSLNKVSKDWRSSYNKEDLTFCEIKKSNQECAQKPILIELTDSDEESPKPLRKRAVREKRQKENEPDHLSTSRLSHVKKSSPSQSKLVSRGVVIKCGNEFVIALSDSDEETSPKNENTAGEDAQIKTSRKCKSKSTSPIDKCGGVSVARSPDSSHSSSSNSSKKKAAEEDVEFICEYSYSKPCPKRFKVPAPQLPAALSANVIILSDSEDESDVGNLYISSYTSLAKAYQNLNHHLETPTKNAQKSILGPLICSPSKELQSQNQIKTPTTVNQVSRKVLSSDDEDILKPTKEELYLRKKKNRTYYPEETNIKKKQFEEPYKIKVHNQSEFMFTLGMNKKTSSPVVHPTSVGKNPSRTADFVALIRSMRASFNRMPLDWIGAMSTSNHIILSKKSSRSKIFDPTKINYESLCSTDKTFIEYSIKSSNASVGKEGRSDSHQAVGRGTDKTSWTVEKWCTQSKEASQRSKRASLRMLRSLSSDKASDITANLYFGTLAPQLHRLPISLFEKALQMPINLKDTF